MGGTLPIHNPVSRALAARAPPLVASVDGAHEPVEQEREQPQRGHSRGLAAKTRIKIE